MAIMEGFGMLAQLVEQRTFNPLVGGSSPPRPTKNKKIKSLALPGFFACATARCCGAREFHIEVLYGVNCDCVTLVL